MDSKELDRPVAVLGLALAGWGGAVALATFNGVFARLSEPAALALAILAFAAAPAALALDAGLREYVARTRTRTLATGLAVLLVAGTALVAAALRRHGLTLEAGLAPSFALMTYFVGPLALGIAGALLQRAVANVRRSAPARSPAAKRPAPRGSRTNARGAGAAGA